MNTEIIFQEAFSALEQSNCKTLVAFSNCPETHDIFVQAAKAGVLDRLPFKVESVTYAECLDIMNNKAYSRKQFQANYRRHYQVVANVDGLLESVFGIDIFGEDAENTLSLPPKLDNDLARQIFGKAIAKGWMVKTSNGCKWMDIYGQRRHGAKARLTFLCDRIYCDGEFPAKALEDFFGEKRLWSALNKLYGNDDRKPKHGAEEILKLFEE